MSGEFAHLNPAGRGEKIRQAIIETIVAHVQERGYPPTIREIGAAVGLASTATVHHHLAELVSEGRIVKDDTKPRAIRVVA